MDKKNWILLGIMAALGLTLTQGAVYGQTAGVTEMENLINKKIVMIISAGDFRDEELNVPLTYFQTKGAKVDIASSVLKPVKGMLGAMATPNMLYTKVNPSDYDAVIFVGGGGATQYWKDTVAHKIAQDAVASGKILAAICYAPVTLVNAGVLAGKKATVWPDEETLPYFEKAGVSPTKSDVEVDGKIVTGIGPKAVYKFAREIERELLK